MPLTDNHSQGAFQLSRSLFTSDIWEMPPTYLKIFIYIIGKANHERKRYRGFTVERGQYFCHSGELLDQLRYYIGCCRKNASDSTAKRVLKYLRDTNRITTAKKPRGILITVINYDKYQNLTNYERTKEHTNEDSKDRLKENQQRPSINKNENNENNEKNYKNTNVRFETKALFDSIEEMCNRHGITNVVTVESLDPIVERYLGKIKMKVELQHHASWLLERKIDSLTTKGLGNWFKKAQEIQKREQLKQMENYNAPKNLENT